MGALLNRVRTRLFGTPDFQHTDVTDELKGAGTAFATLIEGIGQAVAKTTQELDQTAGHIATEMAGLEVDTVQAVVSNYADSGQLTGVSVITGKTSALSIAVPPALSFKRVHLEGSFFAREFSATSTANVNINLAGASIGSRGFGLRGPTGGASVVNANTDIQTAQTEDLSVASMSMTAQITPKPVREVAKPPLVFKGPSLTLTEFGRPPIAVLRPLPLLPADPPYLEQRRAVIQIELKNAAGGVISAPRPIAIDCGTLDWGVTNSSGADVTTGPIPDSSTGSFYITVSRTATSSGDAKKDFVIRAALNLVNATLTVSL
jgi:hypothetical protein